MDIVQLTSKSMKELRNQRLNIMKGMIEGQEGSLLVLSGAFTGANRQHHTVSYAVFSIFYELWERFSMESWSYTFDKEGLMFYIKLEEDALKIKEVLVHYEDFHPLGFAIESDVLSKDQLITRDLIGFNPRLEPFTKNPLESELDGVNEDPKYALNFIKKIESEIVQGDRQTILSNIMVYSYVTAFTKPLGFGMYGPNYRGSNDQMNFEKLIHLVRAYKMEVLNIFNYNSNRIEDIIAFQNKVESKISHAVLNQQSYKYTVLMSSMVMFAFINSRGYADISKQVRALSAVLEDKGVFEGEGKRYDITKNGMRELFNYTVPFFQKNKTVESTLLYLLSRHKDDSILLHNGEQNLLKVQFLAKNLMLKEDKWIEMNKFCTSSYIYPHDSTQLMVVVAMLDLFQRNYLKIKMMFDRNK